MRRLHRAAATFAVIVAGVVLGSGVGGYALSPANEACLWLQHGGSTGGNATYSFVPFGTRCGEGADAIVLAPSVPAWIAWMAAMTALVGAAALRPGTRAMAGALAAAGLVTVAGVASHSGTDFIFTAWVAAVFGSAVALVTRHLWLAGEERAWWRSVAVVGALAPTTFFVATFFNFVGGSWGHLGGVLALAAGAVISANAARWWASFLAAGE